MAIIEKILNEDGTEYCPPPNPLKEKWNRLYPPCSSGLGYGCIYCGKCPCGEYWKIPDEDKDEWNAYKKTVHQYNLDHGNVFNDMHRDMLKKMLLVVKDVERIEYEESKNLH